jgi:hypothetical protein
MGHMRVSGAGGLVSRSLEVGEIFHMGYPIGKSGRGKPSRPGKLRQYWEILEKASK